jgi:hypothetical protein
LGYLSKDKFNHLVAARDNTTSYSSACPGQNRIMRKQSEKRGQLSNLLENQGILFEVTI